MGTPEQNVSQYTIRWYDSATPEIRAKFLDRIEKIRPATNRRRRGMNHARMRAAFERSGEAVLESPDRSEHDDFKWVVRIYYRSSGGETLAIETAPLHHTAATNLHREHGTSFRTSEALGADCFRVDHPDEIPELWPGARLVTLPSQSSDRPVKIAEEIPVFDAIVQVIQKPRERLRSQSLYTQAMRRRAVRMGLPEMGASL